MGLLSGLFGGGNDYDAEDARRREKEIIDDPNQTLQDRQDAVLGNASVARLVSPEGRADMFQGIATRLDSSYSNAMTMGMGNLSRAGLGSGSASALLKMRMNKDRQTDISTASAQADLSSGQFVAGLFSDFRKEHMNQTQMRLNYEAGVQGNLAQAKSASSGMMGGLMSGAGSALGGWLASSGGGAAGGAAAGGASGAASGAAAGSWGGPWGMAIGAGIGLILANNS